MARYNCVRINLRASILQTPLLGACLCTPITSTPLGLAYARPSHQRHWGFLMHAHHINAIGACLCTPIASTPLGLAYARPSHQCHWGLLMHAHRINAIGACLCTPITSTPLGLAYARPSHQRHWGLLMHAHHINAKHFEFPPPPPPPPNCKSCMNPWRDAIGSPETRLVFNNTSS